MLGAGASKDALGQQYDTPRSAVLERGVDVIIVGGFIDRRKRGGASLLGAAGRGVYASKRPAAQAAEEYRKAGWDAYVARLQGGAPTAKL